MKHFILEWFENNSEGTLDEFYKWFDKKIEATDWKVNWDEGKIKRGILGTYNLWEELLTFLIEQKKIILTKKNIIQQKII